MIAWLFAVPVVVLVYPMFVLGARADRTHDDLSLSTEEHIFN